MGHPVMWFEVLGQDGDKLRQFYIGLFKWTIAADNPIRGAGLRAPGSGRRASRPYNAFSLRPPRRCSPSQGMRDGNPWFQHVHAREASIREVVR
jgi:hypothetical protein